jgi:hypothetical protein
MKNEEYDTRSLEERTGLTPTVNLYCQYSAKHNRAYVPAVTTIDCGRVGMIPACQECADFYKRMSS